MEKIRQPKNFQDRVIETFLSEGNSEYLYNLIYYNLIKLNILPENVQQALQTFIADMISFTSSQGGDIYNILDSDNLAMRAKMQYGINVWDEVKRLNIVFYQNRMNNYVNNDYGPLRQYSAPYCQNGAPYCQNVVNPQMRPPAQQTYSNYDKLLNHVPVDGAVEDNEDYAMKMFISDSLQPEGYEYLNNMGPKYELLENQHEWSKKNGKNKYDMGNGLSATGGNSTETGTEDDDIDFDVGLAIAMADPVKYKTMRANQKSNLVGSENADFMRYKEIPFWQQLPREGTDTDIDETLGFGAKETKNHVRGWDMSALREKNGKSYTRYYGVMNNGKI